MACATTDSAMVSGASRYRKSTYILERANAAPAGPSKGSIFGRWPQRRMSKLCRLESRQSRKSADKAFLLAPLTEFLLAPLTAHQLALPWLPLHSPSFSFSTLPSGLSSVFLLPLSVPLSVTSVRRQPSILPPHSLHSSRCRKAFTWTWIAFIPFNEL